METDEGFFVELVGHLEARRAAIIEQVLSEVRDSPELPTAKGLGAPQLRDHLPKLLDRLVASLQGAPRVRARLPAESTASEHGHERWEEHYRLDEVVRELGVVERVVLRESLEPLVSGANAAHPEAIVTAREGVRWFFEDTVAASAERFVQDAGRARDDAEQRLREVDASRQALLGVVTHELRGILQTLTLAIEAVGSNAPEADRQRMLDVCHRNLADMAALLEELTKYGGLLAGQLHLEIKSFAVADFAGEIAAAFAPLAQASGVELRVDADVGLEAVRSDPRRLRQIVANLVVNALKYRREGASTWIQITFEAAAEDHWRMAIEDNGVGIAPGDLGRVFEEFQRITPRPDVQGSGLGLTITQRLVRLLGGEVRVDSKLGEGSRFEVVLPRAFPETPESNPVSDRGS